MKRGFVRVLFGENVDYGPGALQKRDVGIVRCRGLLEVDLKLLTHLKYDPPFVLYIYGQDNYDQCMKMGFDCRLVSPNPAEWDINTKGFRHKLGGLQEAMKEFDEIIFLDLDTIPQKAVPETIWEDSYKKAPIQASLRMYKRIKATWRRTHRRTIPTAAYIYIRDKAIPQGIIDSWEATGEPLSEEIALAHYIDQISGGWKGLDHYWDNYEPEFFNLERSLEYKHEDIFSPDQMAQKNLYFHHMDHTDIKRILREIKRGHKSPWVE